MSVSSIAKRPHPVQLGPRRSLPVEVFKHALEFADPRTVFQALACCRDWRKAITEYGPLPIQPGPLDAALRSAVTEFQKPSIQRLLSFGGHSKDSLERLLKDLILQLPKTLTFARIRAEFACSRRLEFLLKNPTFREVSVRAAIEEADRLKASPVINALVGSSQFARLPLRETWKRRLADGLGQAGGAMLTGAILALAIAVPILVTQKLGFFMRENLS